MEPVSTLEELQNTLEERYRQQLQKFSEGTLDKARAALEPVFEKITCPQKRAYLLALCIFPGLHRAAEAAGVHAGTAWLWRKGQIADVEERAAFLDGFETARKLGIENAEEEAWRRSVEGVVEPVFGALPGEYAGNGVIGYKINRSDSMLQFMLKGNDPKYNTSRTELTGANGGPMESKVVMLPSNDRDAQSE